MRPNAPHPQHAVCPRCRPGCFRELGLGIGTDVPPLRLEGLPQSAAHHLDSWLVGTLLHRCHASRSAGQCRRSSQAVANRWGGPGPGGLNRVPADSPPTLARSRVARRCRTLFVPERFALGGAFGVRPRPLRVRCAPRRAAHDPHEGRRSGQGLSDFTHVIHPAKQLCIQSRSQNPCPTTFLGSW